jgi:hypothetical protein
MLLIPRLTILGLLLLAFSGCRRTESDEVKQDRIFCLYEIEYKAAENETYVRAQFSVRKESGSKLELSEPSQIKFGDDVLVFDSQFRYYQRVYTGRRDTGTFVWRDTDDNIYYNFADMSGLNIGCPIGFGNITQSSDYVLTWQGSPLTADQSATLVLEATNSSDAVTATESDENASSLTIKQNAMQNLSLGEYRATLSRSHSKATEIATDAGGTIRTTYSAATQNVVLTQ